MDPNNPTNPSNQSPTPTFTPPSPVEVNPALATPVPAPTDPGVPSAVTDPGLSAGGVTTPSFAPPPDPTATPTFTTDATAAPLAQPTDSAQNIAPSWAATEAGSTPPFGQTIDTTAVPAEPTPTFMPSSDNAGAQGSIIGGTSPESSVNPLDNSSSVGNINSGGSLDTAPTDLSHLVGNNSGGDNSSSLSMPPTPPPSMTVPTSGESKEVVTSGSGGFPKWIILVGVLVLLAVAGGSAYFILGIGRPVTSTSTPTPVEETGNSSQSFVPSEESSTVDTADPNLVNMEVVSPTFNVTPTITSTASTSSALELLKKRKSQ